MKRLGLVVLAIVTSLPANVLAQRHERDAEKVAESGQVRSVTGGTTIAISGSYDSVFDALVTYLKRNGLTIDSASRDAGQIATAMEISGGWRQTGTRKVLSLIKESADKTSVRVAITSQKRYKALQVEPWSDPKVDDKESAAYAKQLKADLSTVASGKD